MIDLERLSETKGVFHCYFTEAIDKFMRNVV